MMMIIYCGNKRREKDSRRVDLLLMEVENLRLCCMVEVDLHGTTVFLSFILSFSLLSLCRNCAPPSVVKGRVKAARR